MKYLVDSGSPVSHFEVQTFEELRDLLENEIEDVSGYVFRGQANTAWELQSTLHRLILNARETGAKGGTPIERFVDAHLERFRLEIRGRRGDNPSKLDDDELWALGQHFGLATPLLDWSRSPYISAFFALHNITDDHSSRALWCLNERRVRDANAGLNDDRKLWLLMPDSDDNKRLLGQSGLFSKGPVMQSVDDWATQHGSSQNPLLLKITFPGDRYFRKASLKRLQLMNINHSSLFPDLFGASQFCNIVAEDYE